MAALLYLTMTIWLSLLRDGWNTGCAGPGKAEEIERHAPHAFCLASARRRATGSDDGGILPPNPLRIFGQM